MTDDMNGADYDDSDDEETAAILADLDAMEAITKAEAERHLGAELLEQANDQLAELVRQAPAFGNLGTYPFEHVHTSALLSIANTLQDISRTLDTLVSDKRKDSDV